MYGLGDLSYGTIDDISQICNLLREEMENLKAQVRQKLQDLKSELKQGTGRDIKVTESKRSRTRI